MYGDEQYQAAGLYNPETDANLGRRELLQWLADQGFTIDEMADAFFRDALGAIAGDRRLRPGPQLDDAESQRLSGLDADTFERVATAFGFVPPNDAPDSWSFTAIEAEAMARWSHLIEMFSEQEGLGFLRVVGTAIARIAEAATSMFVIEVEGPHLAGTGNELELAQKVLAAVGLLDEFMPLLDPVLRRHMQQSAERGRLAIINETERLRYRYAVGFVDLVGFTPISQAMPAQELGEFIREFEGRAQEASTRAGARLVKLIGDEVMFVAPSVDAACRAAQDLMTNVATPGTTVEPRGGMAYGDVLVRGGDYYGEIVNLASRLVDHAQPGELLVSARVADEHSGLAFEPAGARSLKGFAEPVDVCAISFP